MSAPTTSDYLNQTTPAAPSGDQTVVFQSDGATPEQSITAYPKTATASLRGVVKPDGTTITVASDGTISAAAPAGMATQAAVQEESYIYAADTGSANAYAVTLSPAPTIAAGSIVVVKIANANTGASTLAVNGGSATAIKKDGSTALASGDLAAGQIAIFIYDGTNWQIGASASGGAISSLTTTGTSGPATLVSGVLNVPEYGGGGGSGALVLLEEHTASNSVELDFTTSISGTYDDYLIEIINLQVATSGANIEVQFSTDGGGSYDTSNIYAWYQSNMSAGGTVGSNSQAGVSAIRLWATGSSGGGAPAFANPAFNGSFKMFAPGSSSQYKPIMGQGSAVFVGNGAVYMFTVGGHYASNTAVNAFRIIMDSGNIASGTVRVYGLSH